MMAGSSCDCLICQLEARLIADLSDGSRQEDFRLFASLSATLSAFPTALELLEHLHSQDHDANAFSDQVLLEILGQNGDARLDPLRQSLLLLVFIPAIHRAATQITSAFPALSRDDTAQHLFAVLLEFLPSRELQSRRSHLAFTIARRIRRGGFRWAIRESRISLQKEMDGNSDATLEVEARGESSHADILLEQFLDGCERRGWLSLEERELLVQFKLERVSSPELAMRSGHSAVAIRHRVQRLVDRLRRIAGKTASPAPEQLKLFRP
jgi:DNA-directed RNA polymerase specialized sigma24 family protein